MSTQEPSDQLFTSETFGSINLPAPLRDAVDEHGFVHLTRVQAEVLPIALAGRDVVAQAQTGSGKTAAYLLTIFSHILRNPRQSEPNTPRALIVAPTRELAVQIARDAEGLGCLTDLRVHVVFGGLDYRKQRKILEQGTDLLIGTPGRLIDYHKQNAYSLRQTEIVVIDECDRLFDMGFAADLRWLLRRLPPAGKCQAMMFTATLSRRVMTLGWQHMDDPKKVVIDPEKMTPDTISQVLYHVSAREKLSLLLGLLKHEATTRTMVFVNTRVHAQRLVEELQRHGYQARGLTGNVVQTKRLRVLDDFREGRLPILVATDVASRGLHIEGVTHVVNYDLPQDPEDYIHRVGRTARAGAEGMAITLCCDEYVYSLAAIHRLMGYEIPAAFASDNLFHEVLPPGPRKPRRSVSRRPPRPARTSRSRRPPDRVETEAAEEAKPRKRRRRRRPGKKATTPRSESGQAAQEKQQ
jgi:ATP-dependent RNA helicase RhlB